MSNTFYITTPIYYANTPPHLGHLYTTTVADAVRRYKRQRGFETYFLTGTDEHGINIQREAEKNGRSPREQVDLISGKIEAMLAEFHLDPENGGYDFFMRTTMPFHYQAAAEFWKRMAAGKTPLGNDPIYKGHYEGWFCAPCAEFKSENDYILREGEEVPVCATHERPLDRVEEESYFFRLSDYADELVKRISEDADLVRPDSRRKEVLAFIEGGLNDLSISREKKNVSWGIPVPGDEDHVMYVWVDALSNYITAIGFGNSERESIGFEKYWENAVHFVGKDILRFHTVYWFSFLLAAGLNLPKSVFAHGMWLDPEGKKMSSTLGNGIDPDILAKFFQIDSLRYFLLRDMVFGNDGKFGYENLIERSNADLAKGIGNLASRTISMIDKYREGVVPSGEIDDAGFIQAKRSGIAVDDQEIAAIAELARDEFLRHFDEFEFSLALEAAWRFIARVDKFITEAAPWNLAKDESNNETLNAVLYRSMESLRWLAVMLYPVMPESSSSIWRQLGLEGTPSDVDPASLVWGGLTAGTTIGAAEALFPRMEASKIMEEIEKEKEKDAEPEIDYISIDDFLKVELRVGLVLEAGPMEKSDKLLKCLVDVGEKEPRQILAGLALYYKPEELVGKKVLIAYNLKPRKMMGTESQGMICAASLGSGDKPVIATFLEDVAIGARLT